MNRILVMLFSMSVFCSQSAADWVTTVHPTPTLKQSKQISPNQKLSKIIYAKQALKEKINEAVKELNFQGKNNPWLREQLVESLDAKFIEIEKHYPIIVNADPAHVLNETLFGSEDILTIRVDAQYEESTYGWVFYVVVEENKHAIIENENLPKNNN